jgi:recombination protein RecT
MADLKKALTTKEEERNPKTVKDLLASPAMRQQIAHALPKHMNADRMTRIALTLMRQIPDLAACEPKSFMGALMQVSQLGLEPGGALGHAYLIPFKVNRKRGNDWVKVQEVQVIIGYRGMIDLARRSGQIVSLSARVVREKDRFLYAYGLDETLTHVPYEGDDDPGEITHVYAVAKLQGGGVQFEVMTRKQVESVRDKSQGYTGALSNAEKFKKPVDSPWVNNFDEMARKTAVRRLFKYLPVSIEIQTAVGLDEQAEAGINQHNAAVIDGDYDVVQHEEAESVAMKGITVDDVRKALEAAQDEEALDAAWAKLEEAVDKGPEQETELGKLYSSRLKAIKG